MSRKDIEEDLARSGLTIEDIQARELDSPIKAATGTAYSADGYQIPYWTINGLPVQFYRVRLFNQDPKYKQPKESPNHVYFPRGFYQAALSSPYIILTEGEKKAACATKLGIPTASIGGVESWRNRIFLIPADSELNADDKKTRARIPSGTEVQEEYLSPLALGLQDLIDFVLAHNKTLVILFDADHKQKTSANVQKAAASLGYELRFRGIPYQNIRQLRLPPLPNPNGDGGEGTSKAGLDDYLMYAGLKNFNTLLDTVLSKKSAFPRHPNVRDYVNKRLQKSRMSRKEMQQVSMAVLSELDAGGLRLRSEAELQTYYFDNNTHRLLKATFSERPGEFAESHFGQFLYRQFGIGSGDKRIVEWLGTQFTGEEPISSVSPYRVLARPLSNGGKDRDTVIYQISDGAYVEVNGDPSTLEDPTPGLMFKDNGEEGILFESEQVQPLNPTLLKEEYAKQHKTYLQNGHITPWWAEVLNDVRLKDRNNQQKYIAALLFYTSPWLLRWRGTQLPVEMTLGEAGSGKSTLQEFRLEILTGKPKLRNAPQDMRDWTASVATTGGLHITDNLQLVDKNIRNRLSDEICRLITEPTPTVEQRKLYTNADIMELPVRCTFGITAIKQPFLNSDILARSIIIELDKSQDLIDHSLTYDSYWKSNQLHKFGGREAWVAHHLYVLHHFFRLVKTKWNMRYSAKHRLINLEQSLRIMAEVFNLDSSWIPSYLTQSMAHAVEDADWAFSGLIEFASEVRSGNYHLGGLSFTAADVSAWAEGSDEWANCEELVNTRRCGRYMQTHKTMVAEQAGIIEAGKINNRIKYTLALRTNK